MRFLHLHRLHDTCLFHDFALSISEDHSQKSATRMGCG
ncbi:unnamed protein product, partial [Amoebophrya sp. A120]|eukprot:GSA120T00016260001.1